MRLFILTIFSFVLVLTAGCVDKFNPPEIGDAENLLVIDAYVDGQTGTGTVLLRNSVKLSEEIDTLFSSPATVRIEDEKNNIYTFSNEGNGQYKVENMALNYGDKIRLDVAVKGNVYRSDFVEYIRTPEIDSISWSAEKEGLQFYVSTHDPENKSVYYKWQYEETWEFTAPYPSRYEWVGDEILPRENPDELYLCYKINKPGTIIIGTTSNLKEDVISEYPVAFADATTNRFLRLYSILVKQVALREPAYSYWKSLKLNTEGLGGLFDPQPYAIESNIKNIDDPSETVLGYFHVHSQTEKRIFITPPDVPGYDYKTGYEDCRLDTLFSDELNPGSPAVLVEKMYSESGGLIGFFTTPLYCSDCRLRGTSKKPDYWPR